jgi:hypothetical protein
MTANRAHDAAFHKERLLTWLRDAVEGGWLPASEIEALQAVEDRGAERLFGDAAGGRPLTVGFFGGTGVGKSSLLNRLVGEPVARTGVERPTSMEVTLYVHEQYPVRDLDDEFPVERARVLTHHRDEYRDVVWVDMPDIDSVEAANRALVLEWLPCIDWLIYVVSPEKYRDDSGWRVLGLRGHRHHWVFVINRWDTGEVEQYRDFRSMVTEAGFDEPVVLRTSCTEPLDDDFDAMVEMINAAVAEHGLERLQQVGERARLADLDRLCRQYREQLGDPGRWRDFVERGQAVLAERLAALKRYLRDEAAILAGGISDRQAGEDHRARVPDVPALVADYVEDLESAVAIEAGSLPAAPIAARTRGVLVPLGDRVAAAFRDGFRQGMTRPGNAFQRGLVTAMRKLVYGLPLLAGAGVAYVVFQRYGEGLGATGEFLGFDFLAHSLMVLGLSALLPYLLARLLRPSVRRSVVRRVEAGMRGAGEEVREQWCSEINDLARRAGSLAKELEAIRSGIDATPGTAVRE